MAETPSYLHLNPKMAYSFVGLLVQMYEQKLGPVPSLIFRRAFGNSTERLFARIRRVCMEELSHYGSCFVSSNIIST